MNDDVLAQLILLVVFVGAVFYKYIWFYFQCIWIKDPALRRPFTYIMRDVAHKRPLVPITIFFILGRYFGEWILQPKTMITFLIGMLLAHLFFGEPYQHDQQEDPPFEPESDFKNYVDC